MNPPPCMWRQLSERLDRLSRAEGIARHITITGRVLSRGSGIKCSLSVVVDGVLREVRDLSKNGAFRVRVPNRGSVRLVFVEPGSRPRIISIEPIGPEDTRPHILVLADPVVLTAHGDDQRRLADPVDGPPRTTSDGRWRISHHDRPKRERVLPDPLLARAS